MDTLGTNFGDSKKKCDLCGAHSDSQEEVFNTCEIVKQEIPKRCDYQ